MFQCKHVYVHTLRDKLAGQVTELGAQLVQKIIDNSYQLRWRCICVLIVSISYEIANKESEARSYFVSVELAHLG